MRRCVECLPVLVLLGCWEPHETSLFEPGGAQSNLTGGATSAGSASGGSGSSAGYGYGAGAGQETLQSGGTTLYPIGGSGGDQAGGSKGGEGGSASSTAGEGGEGGSAHPPSPASCDTIDGAVTNDSNGHCYRVSLDAVDFATAIEACRVVGAHLVTISSEEENGFVSQLLPQEHWLGATDSRPNTTNGVGEYTWVDGEPWIYSAWREGQPNAKETSCPTQAEGAACYEHCGYQTDQVDWVDRSCWHTIPSVCEWDLERGSK